MHCKEVFAALSVCLSRLNIQHRLLHFCELNAGNPGEKMPDFGAVEKRSFVKKIMQRAFRNFFSVVPFVYSVPE
jgi:hypothetical protein